MMVTAGGVGEGSGVAVGVKVGLGVKVGKGLAVGVLVDRRVGKAVGVTEVQAVITTSSPTDRIRAEWGRKRVAITASVAQQQQGVKLGANGE